eukprot:5823299-Alexandrium_andersonii.AAC.1
MRSSEAELKQSPCGAWNGARADLVRGSRAELMWSSRRGADAEPVLTSHAKLLRGSRAELLQGCRAELVRSSCGARSGARAAELSSRARAELK